MPNGSAIQRRLTGQGDSRSMQGTLSRGNNVYRGGMPNAQQGGGPQFGRPPGPGGPGGMPPQAQGMPQGGPPGGMPAPVENPMAPIIQNMQQLQGIMPTPSGATDNPIISALQQGGPPGEGGVGGNPSKISPEIMAAIVRKLGASGGGNV